MEIDVHTFAEARAAGAAVIDVREAGEYHVGHVPGARLIPLGELPQRVEELGRDERLYLICASGKRSLMAARWLLQRDYDAVSVAGGTLAWIEAGMPIDDGSAPAC